MADEVCKPADPVEGKPAMEERHFAILRRHMIEVIEIYVELARQDLGKAALDERVLAAVERVPRHAFVPAPLARYAYADMPLPIGFDKTISQPFMVAVMTDLLEPQREDMVLEIGTGLGYQTAILAELVGQVWTIEIVEELANEAELRLLQLGYADVNMRVGDGAQGWPEHAPFDKIVVSAAAELCPPALIEQLRPGGRMVLPTGAQHDQHLTVVEKDANGRVRVRDLMPVQFSQLETVR